MYLTCVYLHVRAFHTRTIVGSGFKRLIYAVITNTIWSYISFTFCRFAHCYRFVGLLRAPNGLQLGVQTFTRFEGPRSSVRQRKRIIDFFTAIDGGWLIRESIDLYAAMGYNSVISRFKVSITIEYSQLIMDWWLLHWLITSAIRCHLPFHF